MPDQDLTVTIDSARLGQQMDALYNALMGDGQDVSTLLKDEHRRLVRTIVNLTPPLPARGAKSIGELAVKGDLHSLIGEATENLISNITQQYGTTDIDTYRNFGKGQVRLLWDNVDITGERIKDLHNRYRNSRSGRPPRKRSGPGEWKSRIIVRKGARAPYVQEVQSRVGRWKAAWAYSAVKLGDRYPNWIARHFGHVSSRATVETKLTDPTEKFILFGAKGVNFRENLPRIKAAVQIRINAIKKRIALIVSGYAKDVAAGIRAEAKARKTGNEPMEEVD